ncbi:class I adenylate-forming enzyme family protein [Microbaculum marinum]|uniref:Class I adenylate-forming enzyme family protein n=1 Tax=Microbaculum marinum TaxID=1764581 RepID=A0AAW9RT03_9HYPH
MTEISWKSEWLPLAQRYADRTAVVDRYGAITFANLLDRAAGVAAALTERGIGRGDVVASVVENSRHAVAASYGISLCGAAEAPVNPALSAGDIAYCLNLSGARLVLATAGTVDRLAEVGAPALLVEDIGTTALAALPAVPVPRSGWGRILFTSGTTGKPKGIVHSQGGRWVANMLMRATLPVAAEPGRRVLLMTPYSHGSSLLTQAFLDGGAAVRLVDGVREDEVVPTILAGEVDQIFAPPTVLARLVSFLEGRSVPGIRAIFCGTAPLLPEVYRRARAIFGPVVRLTYGKTEMFNPITVLTPEETDRWYDSPEAGTSICVGWPASGVEVVIEPDGETEGEAEVAAGPGAGEIGHVLLRSPHMLAATLTEAGVEEQPPDGFHRTGDLGFVDREGRLHLVGRESDMIKTGGYRVTPEEVESALRPGLDTGEIVVVGLPSSYWGEVITAVAAGAPDDWRETLKPRIDAMTGYKRPRLFVDVPEIARNAMGKIVRRRIIETILESFVLVDGRYPQLVGRDNAASGS